MASDTGVFVNQTIAGSFRKIVKNKFGDIAAAAGTAGAATEFHVWFVGGEDGKFDPKTPSDSSFEAIIVRRGGKVFEMDSLGRLMCVRAEYYALGASSDFLLGAMAAGASAEDAVKLAVKHTVYATGEIQVEGLW